MCKVFSTKAAQAFKACTLYAYKITKKELYYTYFTVFFVYILGFFILSRLWRMFLLHHLFHFAVGKTVDDKLVAHGRTV